MVKRRSSHGHIIGYGGCFAGGNDDNDDAMSQEGVVRIVPEDSHGRFLLTASRLRQYRRDHRAGLWLRTVAVYTLNIVSCSLSSVCLVFLFCFVFNLSFKLSECDVRALIQPLR